MLSYCFAITLIHVGVFLFDDFSGPLDGDFLGRMLFVEDTLLQSFPVLNYCRDDLVNVILAEADRLRAFRLDQTANFHVDLTGLLIEADIRFPIFITIWSIVIAIDRSLVLGSKVENRC